MNGLIRTSGKALVALSTGGLLGFTALTGTGTAEDRPPAAATPPAATTPSAGPRTYGKGATAEQALKAEIARRGPGAAAAPLVCYRAHVATKGWQESVCHGEPTGTIGRGLAIEAVNVAVTGVGRFCAKAHIRDLDWQEKRCSNGQGSVYVGTEGQNRPMEAFYLELTDNWADTVWGQAHVQDYDWMPVREAPNNITIGMTGAGKRLEAIRLAVYR
ncbi:polysaccharide deacetylase [Actinomadura rubrisoli]|uniref:Polysaccharide deacetylase n=1 Tax=Actinomadura rubrisoli TaxID=2530368 RepID=A0A4R5BZ19_9ACTN|nr:polysaccharide deacetylase [Actinomadura rubrisoli]TDD92488.1 polysaccharide deacetylase [Actinomadura rubrisoli]